MSEVYRTRESQAIGFSVVPEGGSLCAYFKSDSDLETLAASKLRVPVCVTGVGESRKNPAAITNAPNTTNTTDTTDTTDTTHTMVTWPHRKAALADATGNIRHHSPETRDLLTTEVHDGRQSRLHAASIRKAFTGRRASKSSPATRIAQSATERSGVLFGTSSTLTGPGMYPRRRHSPIGGEHAAVEFRCGLRSGNQAPDPACGREGRT